MKEEHTFHHEAMNTEFEIVIAQDAVDFPAARQAARAVFDEVDRLEEELSRFRPTSQIWRLSTLKAGESMHVDFAAWDCLSLAKAVHAATCGAFDITLGPLMHLWRNPDGSQRVPLPGELEAERRRMGMSLFDLDAYHLRVTVHADHILFDLGAVGKGYALDQAVRILEQEGIHSAFLSAGESTVLGLGAEAWPVTLHLEEPRTLQLSGDALSCSGFSVQGNHLMDPRSLEPIPVQPRRSYVVAPTAALSDALSTAFMLMTPDEMSTFLKSHPQVQRVE